jgi:hypothetical protein
VSKRKKTKEEKALKKHNFTHLRKDIKRVETTDGEVVGKQEQAKSYQNPVYLQDFRRVVLFIAVLTALIAILALLVYKTNLFDSIFSRFNIQY